MSEAVAGSASAEPAQAGSLGSVLGGKYRLTRRLGDGAMGTVYAARHERLGREVAVKILRPDLCSHLESAARFQREAELVSRIGHPSIVAVYDFGRAADGSLYYVMELVAGRTLRARLEEGPLSDGEIASLMAPLLSAVHAAHGVGVVHRDLKPDTLTSPASHRCDAPVGGCGQAAESFGQAPRRATPALQLRLIEHEADRRAADLIPCESRASDGACAEQALPLRTAHPRAQGFAGGTCAPPPAPCRFG